MEEYRKVLSRLQNQCSKREYCRADILKKAMKAFEGDREASEKLLASLVKDRFVDDSRYAAAFAREKSRLSGWGPSKIGFALSSKGIDRKTVSEALGEIDEADAARKMRSVLEAKWKVLKDDPQGKFKLLRFGLSRGYEYDSLSPEVESVIKGTSE
jgi:Uncharacterized protein conserved in bacteria